MCSICGGMHERGRVHRGLHVYEKTGRTINADINASLNIARRGGYNVALRYKIMSYQVTSDGIKPLIPCQGANARDLRYGNPTL